jgi:hypothetical protein
MEPDDGIKKKSPPKKDRDLRLKQALRDNLRRRKQPSGADPQGEKGRRRSDSIHLREDSPPADSSSA